jgi:predicted MPP superfamily phosphohydrolase
LVLWVSLLLWILFLINFIIFCFFVIAFSIGKGKLLFAWIMWIFLILSFLAQLYSHYSASLLAKLSYYFSSIYFWVIFTLLLASLTFWLIILWVKLFWLKIDLKYIWIIAIIWVLIYVWYWLWNATRAVIKVQEIDIEKISNSWKNKKVLFFADSHLWHVNWKEFFQKIIDMINEEKPDMVLISWDLFDGSWPDFSYFKEISENFRVKDGIFLVEWNHDFYFWKENFEKIIKETDIKLLNNEFIEIDWVQIVGLDSTSVLNTKEKLQEALSLLEKNWFDKNKPSILLIHEPHYTKELKDFWIDLQLSWHTHDWQMWPLWYVAKFLNEGNGYGLNIMWDFNIYVTNGIGTWWPPMRVGNIPEIVDLRFLSKKNY